MSKDVDEDTSSQEERKPRSLSVTTMFHYFRELFFVIALMVTSYAALFNSLPKIGKPPSPSPFFDRTSLVTDYYRGNMNAAFQRAAEADFIIVMYYAPWDAESQAARKEYEGAAQMFNSEVVFTAISCWAPNSECKEHFPKIKQFPLIVGYPQHNKGIQYKGPLTAVHIAKFVKTLLRPIHRVVHPMDVVQLITIYDAVVVGSFVFSGNLGGPGYFTFYSASLKLLEKDPMNNIAFAITTDKSAAAAIEVDLVPSIRLYLWNETFEFPAEEEYTEDTVATWVWTKSHEVVTWVTPPNYKSKNLSPYLTTGPALILFAPRNPLDGVNPTYSLLKEVALKYYNCDNSTWVSNLAGHLQVHNSRLAGQRVKEERQCWLQRQQEQQAQLREQLTRTSVTVSLALLNTTVCDRICDAGTSSPPVLGPRPEVCMATNKLRAVNGSRTHYSYQTSMLTGAGDTRSPESLLHSWRSEKCQLLGAGQRYYKTVYPGDAESEDVPEVEGLSCTNNRTLAMLALDSLLHFQIAEGLGVDLKRQADQTVLVVVDAAAESQYLLEAPVTRSSLSRLIAAHTRGQLVRHLRSSKTFSERSVTRHRYPVRAREECGHSATESCVPELNAQSFADHVLNRTRAVVLLYHSPYCALCRSVSHVFLLIARYLRYFPGVELARIDGDNNDLPWQYTMETYPSILFFPTFRKSDTRIFSSDLPFTTRNLIHFVLANLEPEAKVPAMISLCMSFDRLQDLEEARRCKSKVQKESYEHTATTLRDIRTTLSKWRRTPRDSPLYSQVTEHRRRLILRLSFLQNSTLLLSTVDRLTRDSQVALDIFSMYDRYISNVQQGER